MKKNIFVLTLFLLVFANELFAKQKFSLTKSSKLYDVEIEVASCADETCSGKGTVKLFTKNTKNLVQEFTSPDLYFNLDKAKQPSTIMELYDEESPLVFGDFNFDGTEDIAIRNGNNSGYGGPSYDVYVYHSTKKKFVISQSLTELASTNLGIFDIDTKRQRIITHTKSGCCWHSTIEYSVVPKKDLVKVYEYIEDASKGDDFVYLTEKKFVKGKWTKISKVALIKDYYKD